MVISHRSFLERLQIVRWCKTHKERYLDAKGVIVFDDPVGDHLLYVRVDSASIFWTHNP
jgi:hypothetical protein